MDSQYEVFSRPKEAGGTKKEFYMKNFFNARIVRLIGIISLALVIGFSIAACKSGGDDGGGGDPKVPGTIAITPASGPVGTLLTATWTPATPPAGETAPVVTFQWKKNGNDIAGQTGLTYTPTEAGKYKITVISAASNPKKYANRDSNTVTITATGGPGGGGGTGGILTFTGDVPTEIQSLLTASVNASVSYFTEQGIFNETTLPADAEELQDFINEATWDNGKRIASLDDTISYINTNKKTKLVDKMGDPINKSGACLLYIKFDNSGNNTWCALVTLTSGSGSIAWSALINANDLDSGEEEEEE